VREAYAMHLPCMVPSCEAVSQYLSQVMLIMRAMLEVRSCGYGGFLSVVRFHFSGCDVLVSHFKHDGYPCPYGRPLMKTAGNLRRLFPD
jgi:hypothetical protein